MNDQDDLRAVRELRAAVERLPREVSPARDLWPEIAGRLERRPARPRPGHGWLRLAAAMALLAGGLLTAVVMRPQGPSTGAMAARPEASGQQMAASHLRQRDGVLHAHNDLVAVVARRSGRLDDDGAAALAAGLAQLELATAEIEEALAAHPGDRRLRLALAASYRRESGWTARLGRV